jgi:hypothetical protein
VDDSSVHFFLCRKVGSAPFGDILRLQEIKRELVGEVALDHVGLLGEV